MCYSHRRNQRALWARVLRDPAWSGVRWVRRFKSATYHTETCALYYTALLYVYIAFTINGTRRFGCFQVPNVLVLGTHKSELPLCITLSRQLPFYRILFTGASIHQISRLMLNRRQTQAGVLAPQRQRFASDPV